MSVSIRDTDRGYKKTISNLVKISGTTSVTVGVSDKEGSVQVRPGVTLMDIALWMEFGTSDGHVPPRSYLRAWFDQNQARAKDMLVSLVTQAARGEMTNDQAVHKFGEWAAGQIRARIKAGIPPENKMSTILKKGSDIPLIDTEFLLNSIWYEVQR